MKKNDWILLGLGVVVLVLGLFIYQDKDKGNRKIWVNSITYNEYEEKIASNEPFIVIIVRDGCYYCGLYEPIVKAVFNKLEVPVYLIDTATLSETEFNSLKTSNEYFGKNPKWGTPTTILLQGTKDLDSIGGYVENSVLTEFVNKHLDLLNKDGE